MNKEAADVVASVEVWYQCHANFVILAECQMSTCADLINTVCNFTGRGGGRGGFSNSYNQGPPAEVVGKILNCRVDLNVLCSLNL